MSNAEKTWQPFKEPLRNTLLRTFLIAAIGGAVLAWRTGGMARWPVAFILVLWFSLGGHFVELFFLNWLRPRIPPARPLQIATRLLVWFVGGIALFCAMQATATLLRAAPAGLWHWWWAGGLGFIAVELLAHFVMQLLGLRNFYNGRG